LLHYRRVIVAELVESCVILRRELQAVAPELTLPEPPAVPEALDDPDINQAGARG
jgi:hypothetical protein